MFLISIYYRRLMKLPNALGNAEDTGRCAFPGISFAAIKPSTRAEVASLWPFASLPASYFTVPDSDTTLWTF